MSIMVKALGKASRAMTMLKRARLSVRQLKAQRSEFYIDLWNRAAEEVGAAVEDSRGELLTISRGESIARVFRNYTDLDGPVTLRAAGNKPLVHKTLRAQGLPTPDYLQFSLKKMPAAIDFLKLHGECVIKPAANTGAGEGVTTNVATRAQLNRAAIAAAGYGSELLIEEQISGVNARLLYLDGVLLDAVPRCPPVIVGDGRSTIGQLVRQTNKHRIQNGYSVAQTTLKYDLDAKRTLDGQGLSWRSVPAEGQPITLKTVVNDNAAAENVSVTDQVAESVVEVGRRAARAIGVRLAGVDIVTPDLGSDLESVGGVVLEVNTTPGLYIHEGGQGGPVAASILEACLALSRQNLTRQDDEAFAAVME